MASIGEVVAALRHVIDELPFTPLADASELVMDARTLIEQAAAGSGQNELLQVAEWFGRTAEGITELQQLLSVIQQTATATANRLEGQPGATPPDSSTPPFSPSSLPPPAPPPQGSSTTIRPQTMLERLPRRSDTNTKTHGIWIDSQGREREMIVSGWDEAQAKATDVLRGLGIGPRRGELLVAGHVEVKLAAQLRDSTETTVTLVVNNQPCDTGRWSCNRLLPRILRPGQQVIVHWPGGVTKYEGKAS